MPIDKDKDPPYNRPRRPRGGLEVQLYSFFNLGARRGGSSTPRPCRFTLGKDSGTRCIGGGWAPGSVWMAAENLALTEIRSLDRPASRESLYRLKEPRLLLIGSRAFG
jgi:hypothetical protein